MVLPKLVFVTSGFRTRQRFQNHSVCSGKHHQTCADISINKNKLPNSNLSLLLRYSNSFLKIYNWGSKMLLMHLELQYFFFQKILCYLSSIRIFIIIE